MTTPTPCPLCDKPPLIESMYSMARGEPYFICTHRCEEGTMPQFYIEMSDDFATKEKAVEAWNLFMEKVKGKR